MLRRASTHALIRTPLGIRRVTIGIIYRGDRLARDKVTMLPQWVTLCTFPTRGALFARCEGFARLRRWGGMVAPVVTLLVYL